MNNKFQAVLSAMVTGFVSINLISVHALLFNAKPAFAYNICGNDGKNITNYETRNYWVSICEKDKRNFLVSSPKNNLVDRTLVRVRPKNGGWRGEDQRDNEHDINNRRYKISIWDGEEIVDPVIGISQGNNNDSTTDQPETCDRDYKNIINYETQYHWVNICQKQNRYFLFSHAKNYQANSQVIRVNRQNNGWYGQENDYQYLVNNQIYQVTYENRPKISEAVIRINNQTVNPVRPTNPDITQSKQRRTCYVNRSQGLYVFASPNSSTNPIRTLKPDERIEIFGNMLPNNFNQRFVQLTSPINGYIVASDTSGNYLKDCSRPW